MRGQFFDYEAVLRRVSAVLNQLHILLITGIMQGYQGISHRWKSMLLKPCLRHRLRQALLSQLIDQLLHDFAQRKLMQAVGAGIDRCQVMIQPGRRLRIDYFIFGMNHFKSAHHHACFTECSHPGPFFQAMLLGGAEMKKAQGDEAGAIRKLDDQYPAAAPTAAETDCRLQYFGLKQKPLPVLD